MGAAHEPRQSTRPEGPEWIASELYSRGAAVRRCHQHHPQL